VRGAGGGALRGRRRRAGHDLNLAVVAALPFPAPQGSQVYAREQIGALERAGATATLLCYGRGTGPPPPGLACLRVPAALSPRRTRAGPSAAKPVADAALAALLLSAHRRRRFDAVLAHNAEGALAALAARRLMRVPVIYVAHTLWACELESWAPRALARAAGALGERLDRALAARADAVLALTEAAARRLAPFARGPVRAIPPGLDPRPPPAREEQERACARARVAPGRFALYAGNLDRYQDLADLEGAARTLTELPVLVATHAPPPARAGALRILRVTDADEARALTFAAAVAVLPRRRHGGFPVKLLNYMAAARPIVARRAVVDGLEHGVSAWLVDAAAGPEALARAIRELAAEPARAARLGCAARAVLEARHAWPPLARRTLALVDEARRAREELTNP
jgi:glycosyltransferase involved in cell wall biosynthesis